MLRVLINQESMVRSGSETPPNNLVVVMAGAVIEESDMNGSGACVPARSARYKHAPRTKRRITLARPNVPRELRDRHILHKTVLTLFSKTKNIYFKHPSPLVSCDPVLSAHNFF